ncbi:hypothetical protein GLW08_12295 [Pontibacillus yanchengensis]|uniref:Uncharacterized protein n=1 Tax=Pontibacillus yanchengensis TaxID=462910 RepID=A0ACC7VF88_9BACI|nr:hypothetical protein [Pontibacillus yanchengensis]MYL54118.1 hypothetical protein [Pontibacillus yanchengensis]
MTLSKVITEINGGGLAYCILYLILLIISSILILILYRQQRGRYIWLGLIMHAAMSLFVSDTIIKFTFFPDGHYINYGLGGAAIRFNASMVCSICISFLLTVVVYFEVVVKKLIHADYSSSY